MRGVNGIIFQSFIEESNHSLRNVPRYMERMKFIFRLWTTSDSTTEEILIAMQIFRQQRGHYGVDKTKPLLVGRFYWPLMRNKVYLWSKSCIACDQRNNANQYNCQKMVENVNDLCWERVGTDITGLLLITQRMSIYFGCPRLFFEI
ncbi:hypothetical protein RF11_12065 [Thelohanellus kitauei]|uniref:Integrase zinc-binding domain-containing protein n=1 Tax=Thelohanellus kitauei TaxID=669202 RepID=A0A0C2MX89_THEKT|nr:hypothetical protein RF11_12065 [Thelohanellus kitauei]